MRRLLVTLFAVFTLVPAVGFAAVQGSMHDVDAYTTVEGNKGGACAYCHIPHGAAGQKLYKDSIAPSGLRWGTATQVVSLICTTCHNASGGGIIVGARRTTAPSNDNAHRDNVALLGAWGDNSAPIAGVKVTSAGLLECSSCHDPHVVTTRPFLTLTTTAGDINTNCITCHVNRSNSSVANGGQNNHITAPGSPGGFASQHPTNLTTGDAMTGTEPDGFGTINLAFSTAPVTGANVAAGPFWHSSGKYNQKGGTANAVGCNTCHAVHGVESGANGETGTVAFYNDTQKGTGVVVLAMANAVGTTSAFCQGCHAAGTNGDGVVTAAGAKHPVNTASTNWRTNVTLTSTTYARYWTWGTTGEIVCDTCHDAHFGSDNTAILRKMAGNQAGQLNGPIDNEAAPNWASLGAFCKDCHANSPGQAPTFASGNHHPVSYDKFGNQLPLTFQLRGAAYTNGSNIMGETTGNTMHATAANTNWATRARTGETGLYSFALNPTGFNPGTYMTCGSCHFNTSAGGFDPATIGAHTVHIPLDTNTESEMCVDCHGFNPSQLTLEYMKATTNPLPDNALMTHFVGTILTTGAPTQNQSPPGYKRATAWTGQTLVPIYGESGGTAIICESCHSWKPGNANSVNLNALGHDNSLAQNVVYGMLAPGGNNYDGTAWEAYLCSGCHGESPGGGSSHPTAPNSATAAASATVQTNVTGQTNSGNLDVKQGKATLASTNKPNCDSCHRAHNASFGTGALILEAGLTTPASSKPEYQLAKDNGVGNTQWLNQEGLCSRCHTQGK